jgi:hypothetical protein
MPRSGHDKARSGDGASGSQFHFIDWPELELAFNELTLLEARLRKIMPN